MSNAKRPPLTDKDATHNSKSRGKSYNAGNLTWVPTSLNDADKRWLSANNDHAHEYIFALLDSLSRGYTLSSKYDDKSDRWLSTIICSDESDPHYSCALAVRGKTRVISAYILAYIHMVKLSDGWGVSGDGGDDWS